MQLSHTTHRRLPIRRLEQLLPWQAGLLISLITFLICRHLAVRWEAMGSIPVFLAPLMHLLQYLLPTTGVMLSGLSYWSCRRQQQRRRQQASSLHRLTTLSWREFEHLTALYFRSQGYRVTLPLDNGSTALSEMSISKDSATYLVCCTYWRHPEITTKIIEEMRDLYRQSVTDGIMFISHGQLNQSAIAMAEPLPLIRVPAEEVLALSAPAQRVGPV